MASTDLAGLFQATSRRITAGQLVLATIATTPTSEADTLYVRIPSFDGGRERIPLDGWMPRGTTLPSRGDTGVVAPISGQLWLIAWTPAG